MSLSNAIPVPHHNAAVLRESSASLGVRSFLQQVRKLLPMLFTLAIASVAHAQGTMDFSGAQTLMGTFNMSTTTIQQEVVFADSVQVVAEQAMRSIGCQRVHIAEFKYHAEHRVLAGTPEI